jgi:type II secretory pathway pseudopilin PulG
MFLASVLKRNIKNGSGFALIEFSIIFVVIGIIFSAVMAGAELIKNAKLKRLESDLQGYYASTYTYFDRNGRLPGDIDNNGTIDSSVMFFKDLDSENIASRKSTPFGGFYEAGNSTKLTTIGNYVSTSTLVPIDIARTLDDQLDDGFADGTLGNDSGKESGNIRYDIPEMAENVKVFIRL